MKILGLLVSQNGTGNENEFFARKSLEQYCEDILDYEDREEIASYSPDWVMVLNTNEIFSPRMSFMFNSLILNDYVNIWTSKCLYFWDSEDVYRIDKLWGSQHFPTMYRYIPEVDYQWHEDKLIPINQPGPTEDSSVPVFSYRYLYDNERLAEWIEFNALRADYNYVTQMHYDSLMDDEIKLERWIE